MGSPLLVGHAAPLHAGGEGGTTASRQARGDHLGNDLVGPHCQRSVQRLVAAMGPVVLQTGRIDYAHSGQQPEVRGAGLREGHRGGGDLLGDGCCHLGRRHRAVPGTVIHRGDSQVERTGALHQDRRAPLTLAEAGAGLHVMALGPKVLNQAHGTE